MKTINKIFLAAAACLTLASCSHKAEFTTSSYVNFESIAYAFAEDEGTVTIPVYATPKGKEFAKTTVTFEVKESENGAKLGENFTISPENGILTFDGTGNVAEITITIVDKPGVFTNNLSFDVILTGGTAGFTAGGIYGTTVTIKDKDHPLAEFFGTWTGQSADYWNTDEDEDGSPDIYDFAVVISASESGLSDVTVANLFGGLSEMYPHSMTGTVNDEKTQIAIKNNSWVIKGYGLYLMTTGNYLILSYDATAKTLTAMQPFLAATSSGGADGYPAGVVLTKQP